MGVAVTHRLHSARLGRCYDSFHEVHGIPDSCEIIAASFSAMVMEFLNDPGNGWYCTATLPATACHVLRRVMRDRSPSVEMRHSEASQQWAVGDLPMNTPLAASVRGAVPFRW
jgi:hypothetical protein